MNNLLMAIHAEHKQRTGHEAFKIWSGRSSAESCAVCRYIQAEENEIESARQSEYEKLKEERLVAAL